VDNADRCESRIRQSSASETYTDAIGFFRNQGRLEALMFVTLCPTSADFSPAQPNTSARQKRRFYIHWIVSASPNVEVRFMLRPKLQSLSTIYGWCVRATEFCPYLWAVCELKTLTVSVVAHQLATLRTPHPVIGSTVTAQLSDHNRYFMSAIRTIGVATLSF
jgi:hypothetical protein